MASGIWSRLNGLIFGAAVGRAGSDAVTPVLENAKQRAWAERAVRVLPAEVAAEASSRGIDRDVAYADDAKRQGIGRNRFNVLVDLARTYPGLSELLALWRRDDTLGDDVRLALRRQGYSDTWAQRLEQLRFSPMDSGTLAQLVARGLLDDDVAKPLAARGGTTGDNFARMVTAASQSPQVGQVLDYGNRHRQTDDEVAVNLEATGLRPAWRGRIASLRHYLTPPSDLIRQAVREAFTPELRAELTLDEDFPEAFADRAELIGMSRDIAKDYWAAHWDLPSYTQANQMLFRGEISRAQYRDLLRALDYAPTWRGKLEAIARAIPTITDFQRLVRRGVYGGDERQEFQYDAEYPAAFTEKMALHGMSEQDARDLWAGGWRMPSAGQLYRMLWREQIDGAQLRKGLKALDYPVFWRDKLANIARPVPGRIDTRRMLAAGLISPEQATTNYRHMGYTAADAALMVRLATADTPSAARDLTVAQLTEEYEGDYITREEYLSRLEALSYSPAEAEQLVLLGNARRIARARSQREARIHTSFVGHKISAADARDALDAAGVPTAAVNRLLTEWEGEREVNVRVLTPAQIKKAYAKALIPREVAMDELTNAGYSDADAVLFLDQ